MLKKQGDVIGDSYMKILYFSDKYAFDVMGIKRSIFEELGRRGIDAIFQEKSGIGRILELIKIHNPNQIWLAHSGLMIAKETKSNIDIPIIGFGFSDPYYFLEGRLKSYDVYITNHRKTYLYLRTKFKIPIYHNPSACDLLFHKNLELKKDIDISCIGLGEHPRFKDKRERIKIVNRLRGETEFNIHVYGRKWPRQNKNFSHIGGGEFLRVINRSKIGLDIQDANSPLSHRIFEYSACGTPTITREKDEVHRVFKRDREILTYSDYDDLKGKLTFYLRNPEKLSQMGLNAQKRCVREHDIRHRVKRILKFLNAKNFK